LSVKKSESSLDVPTGGTGENPSHVGEDFSKLYTIYNIKCYLIWIIKYRKSVLYGDFIFYGYALNIKKVFMYKAIIINLFLMGALCSSVINCVRKKAKPQKALSKEFLKLEYKNCLPFKKRPLVQMQKIEKKPIKVNGMAAKTSKQSTINPNKCETCEFVSRAKKGEYNRRRHEAKNHGICPGYCKNSDLQRCREFHVIIIKSHHHSIKI